jgi:hypothetical protein
LAQIDVLLHLVENGNGRLALELAQAIYGPGASELRVQQDLMRLVNSGEIERRGLGLTSSGAATDCSPFCIYRRTGQNSPQTRP